jgi:hypothetical protein
MFERVNASDAAKCLVKELSAHGVQDGDIVEGVMSALMEKKSTKSISCIFYFHRRRI